MSKKFNVAIAQQDFLVGDVSGNTQKIIDATHTAQQQSAQLVVFPELTLVGYPPEDLLWRPGLRLAVEHAVSRLMKELPSGIAAVVGHPHWEAGVLYNAATVFYNGKCLARYFKQELPNYSVFDEKRYFSAGEQACVFELDGVSVGVTICEDIWFEKPSRMAADAGANVIVNLNASPFDYTKPAQRELAVARRSEETELPVVYTNLVGAQDELVFDGASFVAYSGEVCARMASFEEAIMSFGFDTNAQGALVPGRSGMQLLPHKEKVHAVYDAMVSGVRDYVRNNGFKGAVIGLSGGIDSAVTLMVAVDALGAENVEAVMLPSRYTSQMSLDDAQALANNMAVEYRVISIEQSFEAFLATLSEEFAGTEPDVTEENIQARCRGVILMAISNKKGKIVLTTGNKSELAMGYSTLYGDMAGGFNVLKDAPKTLVYEVAEFCNRDKEQIPRRIIDRPPSAELRPDQTDQDSLPPYEVLDAILERYVEKDESISAIIAAGYDEAIVRRVVWLLDRNEYKRRQAAPGVKITARAFGKDRRFPITSGYSELNNEGG